MFQSLVFCLNGFPYSKKIQYTKDIKNEGGETTYALTKKTTHLILESDQFNAYAIKEAAKQSTFVLKEEFITKSLAQGYKAEERDFLIETKQESTFPLDLNVSQPVEYPEEPVASAIEVPASPKKTPSFPKQHSPKKTKKVIDTPKPIPVIEEAMSPVKPSKRDPRKGKKIEEVDDSEEPEAKPKKPTKAIHQAQSVQKPTESPKMDLEDDSSWINLPFLKVPAIRSGSNGDVWPANSDAYDILKRIVLQVTDISTNHNKYYSLEIHKANFPVRKQFRLFSHYGRTDDLQSNPEAGIKECRYFDSLDQAKGAWAQLMKDKTSGKKGYKPIRVFSAKIGSVKARGISSENSPEIRKINTASNLHPELQELVRYIFDEATKTLTSTVATTITQNGIETPLGSLSIEQIWQGEAILDLIAQELAGVPNEKSLENLSNQFYTTIPHRIGRSKEEVRSAIIRDTFQLEKKQETLQLMKDMLQVNENGVLFHHEVDMKYRALRCTIEPLQKFSEEFDEISQKIIQSQVKSNDIRIVGIYKIKREPEFSDFKSDLHNQQLLFHGSRASNYVGLLSRGILLPKSVVKLGVKRTDFGFLGAGIYFGSAACTATMYAHEGSKKTRLMLVCRVALGSVKDYHKITSDLESAPDGYDSVHGVRTDSWTPSDFKEDEYVIYNTNQQRQEYLVEYEASSLAQNQAPSSVQPTPVTQPVTHVNLPKIPTVAQAEAKKVKKSVPEKIPGKEIIPERMTLPKNRFNPNVDAHPAIPSSFGNVALPIQVENSPTFNLNEIQLGRVENVVPPSQALTRSRPPYELPEELSRVKDHEDYLRSLYAQDRNNSEISDYYCNLIDVYSHSRDFVYQDETPDELKIHKILTADRAQYRGVTGTPSVVSERKFHENWKTFTAGQFDGMDWSNIFVAGGSVLACMRSFDDNNPAFKNSDIDLFVCGIESQEEANRKIRYIYDVISKNTSNSAKIIRTKHAVTIINSFPYRHTQIVLRLYKSGAEVLMGFDIDSVTVGFDGKRAWALPRAQRAINKGYNLIDMSRRSLTYETRLLKYSKRGFAVAVPGFDRYRVDHRMFRNVSFRDAKGLAKLLLEEFRSLNTKKGTKPKIPGKKKKVPKRAQRRPVNDEDGDSVDLEEEGDEETEESDYSELGDIPWGPGWAPNQIMRVLDSKDKAQFFSKEKVQHSHIFVSGIEGVLEGKSYWCKICQATTSFGPLSWLTENPGRQLLTGSFHPVSDSLWDSQALVPPELDPIVATCNAANCADLRKFDEFSSYSQINEFDSKNWTPLAYACFSGNLEIVKSVIENGGDFNLKFSAEQFSPLHLAVLIDSTEILEYLLSRGADPDPKSAHGVTPLHMASYYGNVEIFKILIDRGSQTSHTDANKSNALHYAAMGDQPEMIQFMKNLLTSFPDPKQLATTKNSRKFLGALGIDHPYSRPQYYPKYPVTEELPLHRSIADMYPIPAVEALMNAQTVQLEDRFKTTALHIAAQVNYSDVIPKLVSLGSNLNSQDYKGQTPLHLAARFGNVDSLVTLLTLGADSGIPNFLEQTPLAYVLHELGKFSEQNPESFDSLPNADRHAKLLKIREIFILKLQVPISLISTTPIPNQSGRMKLAPKNFRPNSPPARMSVPKVPKQLARAPTNPKISSQVPMGTLGNFGSPKQTLFPNLPMSPAQSFFNLSPFKSPMGTLGTMGMSNSPKTPQFQHETHLLPSSPSQLIAPNPAGFQFDLAAFAHPTSTFQVESPYKLNQPVFNLNPPSIFNLNDLTPQLSSKSALSNNSDANFLDIILQLEKLGKISQDEKRKLKQDLISGKLDSSQIRSLMSSYQLNGDLSTFLGNFRSTFNLSSINFSSSFNLSQQLPKPSTKKSVSRAFWEHLGTVHVSNYPDFPGNSRILGFDMDGTLIHPKSGAKFPQNRQDWDWWNSQVEFKLKEKFQEGFKIVIFTNQGGVEKNNQKLDDILGKLDDISERLGIPIQSFVATHKDHWRKPSPDMWNLFVEKYNGGVQPDLDACIFVGDAAGRPKNWKFGAPKDFSCGDRGFAHNISVKFQTPEEFFLGENPAEFQWEGIDPREILNLNSQSISLERSQGQEIVVMVGPPASGKSTYSRRNFVENWGYIHVNRDTLKTQEKCEKVARQALSEGKSVVVDNLNPARATRAVWIDMARQFNCSVRCIHMQTDLELAHHLNAFRERTGGVSAVPDIAYNMFKKNFEEPSESEGFDRLYRIPFVPNFESEQEKKIFLQRMA